MWVLLYYLFYLKHFIWDNLYVKTAVFVCIQYRYMVNEVNWCRVKIYVRTPISRLKKNIVCKRTQVCFINYFLSYNKSTNLVFIKKRGRQAFFYFTFSSFTGLGPVRKIKLLELIMSKSHIITDPHSNLYLCNNPLFNHTEDTEEEHMISQIHSHALTPETNTLLMYSSTD